MVLKHTTEMYGSRLRERKISEAIWNLLYICFSFVFRIPLWVLLLLECLLNLCNIGFNICVSNLCLFFCGNFSYVQFWLVKGQGRLDILCIIVDFTSYGKSMWTQKNFQAVFKSLGSAWWDKLYIKYLMLPFNKKISEWDYVAFSMGEGKEIHYASVSSCCQLTCIVLPVVFTSCPSTSISWSNAICGTIWYHCVCLGSELVNLIKCDMWLYRNDQ